MPLILAYGFQVEVTSIQKPPKWLQQLIKDIPPPPSAPKRESNMRHLTNYVLMVYVIKTFELSIFEEIVKDQMWKATMDEEMNSILKNDTW